MTYSIGNQVAIRRKDGAGEVESFLAVVSAPCARSHATRPVAHLDVGADRAQLKRTTHSLCTTLRIQLAELRVCRSERTSATDMKPVRRDHQPMLQDKQT